MDCDQVDVFMDAAFDVVKRDIVLLQVKLRSLNTKLSAKKTTFESAERVAQVTALHCEASLQVLQHLCVTPNFRDQVLSHKVSFTLNFGAKFCQYKWLC